MRVAWLYWVLPFVVACQLAPPATAINVLTQHNDSFRTGANLSEFVLTTSNVNTGQFGKLYSRRLDGQIYAQPLYVHGLAISNKTRNVIYVCTEHNSVYAFDADAAAASNALWQVNLGPPVPSVDLNNCGDVVPPKSASLPPRSLTLRAERSTWQPRPRRAGTTFTSFMRWICLRATKSLAGLWWCRVLYSARGPAASAARTRLTPCTRTIGPACCC